MHRRRDNESKGVVPLFRSGTVRYPVTDTFHEIIDSRFPIPESSAKVASPYRYGGGREGVGSPPSPTEYRPSTSDNDRPSKRISLQSYRLYFRTAASPAWSLCESHPYASVIKVSAAISSDENLCRGRAPLDPPRFCHPPRFTSSISVRPTGEGSGADGFNLSYPFQRVSIIIFQRKLLPRSRPTTWNRNDHRVSGLSLIRYDVESRYTWNRREIESATEKSPLPIALRLIKYWGRVGIQGRAISRCLENWRARRSVQWQHRHVCSKLRWSFFFSIDLKEIGL